MKWAYGLTIIETKVTMLKIMDKSTKDLLDSRLREITVRLKMLKEERKKTEAALAIFKNPKNHNALSGKVFAGELIFEDKIKTMLGEDFPNGAPTTELFEKINEKWERQIEKTSFSSQLSRLKAENVICLKDKIWNLAKKNKTPPEEEVSG